MQNSQSPKAFLFDVNSRLYVATDASPVDFPTHNLCCDYLQMLTMFGPLYKLVTAYSLVLLLKTFHRSASATSTRSHRPADVDLPSATSITSTGVDATGSSTGSSSRPSSVKRHKDVFYPSAATSLHPSTPGNTLTYHLITSRLALLAVLPTNVYESRRGLIEYNVVFFREGIQEICDADTESRAGGWIW